MIKLIITFNQLSEEKNMIQLKKSVTLSEVASLSGVSLPVVSAILGNGKKGNVRFSQQTFDKVMKIVELTNYRPNRTARKLRENRHGNIGILSRKVGSIHSVILNMMQEAAAAFDQCLVFSEGSENRIPNFLTEDFVDGIVVIDYVYPGLQEQIAASGIPAVWINTGVNAPGAINYNEIEAIRMTVKHLADRGKKNISFFYSVQPHYSEGIRFETLQRTTEDLGLAEPVSFKPEQYIFDKTIHPQLTSEMVDFFKQNPQVDAVIMANDVMGAPLYNAIRELSKTIPDDIAAVGFMDSYIATALYPTLTSLNVNLFETGTKAIKLLNEFIDGNSKNAYPPQMEYELIIRNSS